MYEFITGTPWPQFCLTLDHFLSYAVAVLLPAVASSHGLINRETGSPWEVHLIFGAWLVLHSLHELYWFSQVGGAVDSVSFWSVAKFVALGWFAQVDYYTDVQFIYVSALWGSWLSWYAVVVFTLSNLFGQLLVQNVSMLNKDPAPVAGSFKMRAFEVLHAVLHSHGQRVGFPVSKSDKKRLDEGGKRDLLLPAATLLLKLLGEDVLQAVGQIAFTYWYAGSALVYFSVSTSLFLAAYGTYDLWFQGENTWKVKGVYDGDKNVVVYD
jgi:hypothetical protein